MAVGLLLILSYDDLCQWMSIRKMYFCPVSLCRTAHFLLTFINVQKRLLAFSCFVTVFFTFLANIKS